MTPEDLLHQCWHSLRQGGQLWLFLDYDGTLADFAPTPDEVTPDPALIALLSRLARAPDRLRLVVLSGRRLSHVEQLVPVAGIYRAGSYGLEAVDFDGRRVSAQDAAALRPTLDRLKPIWARLIEGREGFYLEDKGWSLALHARFAAPEAAVSVLDQAAQAAAPAARDPAWRLLGGHRFLEIAPAAGDKGQALRRVLEQHQWPGAGLVYLGDDDKDEIAFRAVTELGGQAVLVAAADRPTAACCRLESPPAAREWLARLAGALEQEEDGRQAAV